MPTTTIPPSKGERKSQNSRKNSAHAASLSTDNNTKPSSGERGSGNFNFTLTRTPNKNTAHENQSPFTNPPIQTDSSTNQVTARSSKKAGERCSQEDQAVDDSRESPQKTNAGGLGVVKVWGAREHRILEAVVDKERQSRRSKFPKKS